MCSSRSDHKGCAVLLNCARLWEVSLQLLRTRRTLDSKTVTLEVISSDTDEDAGGKTQETEDYTIHVKCAPFSRSSSRVVSALVTLQAHQCGRPLLYLHAA